jgi:ribonuclease HII
MLICGLDEVGRGALAGPMIAVASAFVVPGKWVWWDAYEMDNSPVSGVDDSKKLSPTKRRDVFYRILRWESFLDFGIGEVSADEINDMGIEKANSLAFERAVRDLKYDPGYLLIDGDNPLFGWDINRQHHEPRADGRFWPVGAASILAKVIRDDYMVELGTDHPEYGWERNSGYGSKHHQEALQRVGPCHLHRTQFIRKIMGERNA